MIIIILIILTNFSSSIVFLDISEWFTSLLSVVWKSLFPSLVPSPPTHFLALSEWAAGRARTSTVFVQTDVNIIITTPTLSKNGVLVPVPKI